MQEVGRVHENSMSEGTAERHRMVKLGLRV